MDKHLNMNDHLFRKNFASVLLFLFYLKIYLFVKKVEQSAKNKITNHPHDKDKEILLKYFRENISKITDAGEGSEISIRKIRKLPGTVNATYVLELLIKRTDGSSSIIRIVGRHLLTKGIYQRTSSLLKLYGKRILQIRPITYPSERIKAELECSRKMMGARIRMPDIIHSDLHQGYVFTKYVQGENLQDIVHKIGMKKLIENWQITLFEEIGRGLAEIHFNLKLVHGDTASVNWIYEKTNADIFLADWETAGTGDPAWDLAHLIYGIAEDLGKEPGTIVLFDKIFRAIIRGYEEIDADKKVVKRFASYWTHHALSMSPKTHERVFHFLGVPLPKGFRLLSLLTTPLFDKNPPQTYKRLIADQLISRMLRACLTLYNTINLIAGRTNPNIVIIGSSRVKQPLHARIPKS